MASVDMGPCATLGCSRKGQVGMFDCKKAENFLRENDIDAFVDPRPGSVRLSLCKECHPEIERARKRVSDWCPIIPVHLTADAGKRLPVRPPDQIRTEFTQKFLYWCPPPNRDPLFRTGDDHDDAIGAAVDYLRRRVTLRQRTSVDEEICYPKSVPSHIVQQTAPSAKGKLKILPSAVLRSVSEEAKPQTITYRCVGDGDTCVHKVISQAASDRPLVGASKMQHEAREANAAIPPPQRQKFRGCEVELRVTFERDRKTARLHYRGGALAWEHFFGTHTRPGVMPLGLPQCVKAVVTDLSQRLQPKDIVLRAKQGQLPVPPLVSAEIQAAAYDKRFLQQIYTAQKHSRKHALAVELGEPVATVGAATPFRQIEKFLMLQNETHPGRVLLFQRETASRGWMCMLANTDVLNSMQEDWCKSFSEDAKWDWNNSKFPTHNIYVTRPDGQSFLAAVAIATDETEQTKRNIKHMLLENIPCDDPQCEHKLVFHPFEDKTGWVWRRQCSGEKRKYVVMGDKSKAQLGSADAEGLEYAVCVFHSLQAFYSNTLNKVCYTHARPIIDICFRALLFCLTDEQMTQRLGAVSEYLRALARTSPWFLAEDACDELLKHLHTYWFGPGSDWRKATSAQRYLILTDVRLSNRKTNNALERFHRAIDELLFHGFVGGSVLNEIRKLWSDEICSLIPPMGPPPPVVADRASCNMILAAIDLAATVVSDERNNDWHVVSASAGVAHVDAADRTAALASATTLSAESDQLLAATAGVAAETLLPAVRQLADTLTATSAEEQPGDLPLSSAAEAIGRAVEAAVDATCCIVRQDVSGCDDAVARCELAVEACVNALTGMMPCAAGVPVPDRGAAISQCSYVATAAAEIARTAQRVLSARATCDSLRVETAVSADATGAFQQCAEAVLTCARAYQQAISAFGIVLQTGREPEPEPEPGRNIVVELLTGMREALDDAAAAWDAYNRERPDENPDASEPVVDMSAPFSAQRAVDAFIRPADDAFGNAADNSTSSRQWLHLVTAGAYSLAHVGLPPLAVLPQDAQSHRHYRVLYSSSTCTCAAHTFSGNRCKHWYAVFLSRDAEWLTKWDNCNRTDVNAVRAFVRAVISAASAVPQQLLSGADVVTRDPVLGQQSVAAVSSQMPGLLPTHLIYCSAPAQEPTAAVLQSLLPEIESDVRAGALPGRPAKRAPQGSSALPPLQLPSDVNTDPYAPARRGEDARQGLLGNRRRMRLTYQGAANQTAQFYKESLVKIAEIFQKRMENQAESSAASSSAAARPRAPYDSREIVQKKPKTVSVAAAFGLKLFQCAPCHALQVYQAFATQELLVAHCREAHGEMVKAHEELEKAKAARARAAEAVAQASFLRAAAAAAAADDGDDDIAAAAAADDDNAAEVISPQPAVDPVAQAGAQQRKRQARSSNRDFDDFSREAAPESATERRYAARANRTCLSADVIAAAGGKRVRIIAPATGRDGGSESAGDDGGMSDA